MDIKIYLLKNVGLEKMLIVKNLCVNKTINEISILTGVSIKNISRIRKFYNITFVQKRKKTDRIKLIIPEILKSLKNGDTTIEIMKKFNISRSKVLDITKENNLKPNHKDVNPEIKLTYEEEQVLIGGLLGDTHLSYGRCKYPSGCIAHCIKQYDYAVYKQKYMNRFTSKVSLLNKYDKRSNRHYQQAWIVIRAQKALCKYVDEFYINKNKVLPKNLLYKLDGLGLAIWYMDDGSPSYTNYNNLCGFILATMCFSDCELNLIQTFFKEKFDINTSLCKNRCVYIKADSREKFLSLISEHIPKCMEYKISRKKQNN